VAALLVVAVIALRVTYFKPVVVPVAVVRVQEGRVEELVTNNRAGTITARRRAAMGPELGGRVVTVAVEEGDRVRRGALLVAISDADLRAQLTLQERSLEAVRLAAVEACANSDLAQRELDRTRLLLSGGAATQQALEQAEHQRTAAEAQCTASSARIGQAEASRDVARVMLSKTELRAPFDAVVAKVSTHVGEWITPSPAGLPMPPAIELLDTQSIYARAPIDEVDAGRVKAGLPARITMDAFPGQAFAGRVTRVGAYVSEAQQQNRTFDIDVAFDDAALLRTFLPGTSADVEVVLQSRDRVLRVPTSAILQGGRVLVFRDGLLVASPVTVGLSNWEYTEVTGGLRAGDTVVVSLDRPEVRDGARARIESEAKK
jgi:HlyD family secretion protein